MSTHPFKLRNTVIKRQLLQNDDDATLSKYIGQIHCLQKLQMFFPTATTALCTYAGPNISTTASNKKVSERSSKPTFLLHQSLFLHRPIYWHYYYYYYYHHHHHHHHHYQHHHRHRRRVNDLVGPYTMYNGKFHPTFQTNRLLPSSGKLIWYRWMPN